MANLQITIDDGPQPVAGALGPLLTELANRRIKAAFFILGQEVMADGAATRRIRDGGHTLGNHSFDHLEPRASNYTDAQIKDQFRRTHDAVIAATTVAMKQWRAPRLEDIPRVQALLTTGGSPLYSMSHCDVHADSKDSQGSTGAAAMLTAIRVTIAANPGRTMFRVLFHVLGHTAIALPNVLTGLVSDGHELVDFSQTS